MRPTDRLSRWWLRIGVASVVLLGCSASIDSVRDTEPNPTRPDLTVPADVESIEWQVDEPPVDLVDLAEVHASSRLQYDECQQDYAAISSEGSSSRNPQYFC